MIRRDTLRSQIADALRAEILAGRLSAGLRITVKDLAEQYGVSATPVREALVDLAAQGLLDVEEHRGYRVRDYTEAEFRAMVEARALVVEGVFRALPGPGEAAARVAPRSLSAMRRRAEEAERAALAGDLDVLVHYDLRFWREIASLSGNPYITDFLERIRVQCWAFAVPLLRLEPDLPKVFWHGHLALVNAIEELDRQAVQEIIHDYNAHSLALIARLSPRLD